MGRPVLVELDSELDCLRKAAGETICCEEAVVAVDYDAGWKGAEDTDSLEMVEVVLEDWQESIIC